jgi:hypothetical protein
MEFWLRRARKELAISGRLAEISALLSKQDDSSRDWHSDLIRLRNGEWEPPMDDLIRLDGVFARTKTAKITDNEPSLF